MKTSIFILAVLALGCTKSPNGAVKSGYTCTCRYKIQFTGRDTTTYTNYPAGTSASQAAQRCVDLDNFYGVTYGDPTAHCGL